VRMVLSSTGMAPTKAPAGKSEAVIAAEIARIDKAPIELAIDEVMQLARTVDAARTDVVDTKARLIRRACDEGYSVRRVAELMKVSIGYVQRLKTQRNDAPLPQRTKREAKHPSTRGGPIPVSKKRSPAASLVAEVGAPDGIAAPFPRR